MKLVTKLSAISLGAFSIFAPIAVYRSYNVCYTNGRSTFCLRSDWVISINYNYIYHY